jgi:hypothetical protein
VLAGTHKRYVRSINYQQIAYGGSVTSICDPYRCGCELAVLKPFLCQSVKQGIRGTGRGYAGADLCDTLE